MRIKNVKVEVTTEDENGEAYTDLSAPTIDMAIEKMGAFERSLDKRDSFDIEKEAEDEALDDVYKSSELVGDGFAKIEN